MVRAQKKKKEKNWKHSLCSGTERFTKDERKKMNSAQEGISQPCEISQVAKIRKPGKFHTTSKSPCLLQHLQNRENKNLLECTNESEKNYKEK